MIKNKLFNIYYNWWKNLDKIILTLILLLFFLGLFFSLVSTSIIASNKLSTNSYFFFIKHFIFIFIGLLILIFSSVLERSQIIKFYLVLFFISLFFLILVPFIGAEVKGSKRWIDIAFLPRFQPIEILKPFMIVSLSVLLNHQKTKNIYIKYVLSLILIFPIIVLLTFQPDIGQTILVVIVWFSLIFISGVNLYYFGSFLCFMISILTYLVFFVSKFEYIKVRILSFLNPASGNNYQAEKASEAIINGGIFGKGIGEGTLNSKVPEAHTDYIISVISEEFGAIAVIFIMLIYIFLSFKIIKKIDEENDNEVKLILLGSVVLILLQTFIHIGVNISMLPTTGMTLPFLSYGGSSIISTAFISGLILNLTRRKINY